MATTEVIRSASFPDLADEEFFPRLSDAKLEPFIHNMHTALWVLAATSLVGAAVSLMRPKS